MHLCHIHEQCALDCYKETQEALGKKLKYTFDAFLDNRTSKTCRDLDKKTFRVDEAEVGKNFPPMHPNCRSTTYVDVDSSKNDEVKETLTENPKIDDKLVKGFYNKYEIEKLQSISDELKQMGYNPSGHAIQRVFERGIKPARIDDVVKTGKNYTDSKIATAYYKNRLSVHISKETGQIKSVIFYKDGDITPLKRNRNAKRKK